MGEQTNVALVLAIEQIILAGFQALAKAKGIDPTPENVEALRSTIVLVPPKE